MLSVCLVVDGHLMVDKQGAVTCHDVGIASVHVAKHREIQLLMCDIINVALHVADVREFHAELQRRSLGMPLAGTRSAGTGTLVGDIRGRVRNSSNSSSGLVRAGTCRSGPK